MKRILLVATLALAAATLPVVPAVAAATGGGGNVQCQFTPTPENPAARPVTVPKARAKAHGNVSVTIRTNYGRMDLVLNRDNAPCAVHNLLHLARADFYDNSQCFRLTTSARLGVLQCGDIYRAEEGGPGYKFPDEVTGKETYPRGTIAMGNQGPGTNGSEWFIVHSVAQISPVYTVMGRVTRGIEVLDRIVAAGITPDGATDGAPKRPVRVYDVRIGHDC
ncbi:peptidyl-prolyl cis-trans isomerase B (cyclophilin B) [Actinokineospora baliensis]|uniref:peptidylprolyl isomerase n=1 Tax=Actinokineospora baliensis TaxID=547056 RepID=UPI001958EFA3|nr:peptidylprolyl isomerase [Actinokineospora baliensis]MBM7773774.1 peptidyl-prolyl cis-trans isomerase B (cyclophilin B) [Actinokineospora baliensis]